ncbi:MAG: hypothetical protein A2539_07800 [Elusimicrobia bacterium RIFOXYD2_FULL_34_15]|nr:MAG: hypothetical protein A2539_07800 [Elusimicrobia bacterium RIFOXYD2_FULL_34_15]
MSVINSILKEERERLNKLINLYRNRIQKYPKGAISLKKRGKNLYTYLAYRKNKKVHFIYVGKDSTKKVKNIKKQIEQRNKYRNLLIKAKNNLKEVSKTL